MKKIVLSKNSEETQKLGEELARTLLARELQGLSLVKNRIIALYGELGSGKTTFVQGLARGLGIKNKIISPTFIIMRTYEFKTQRSNLKTTAQNSKLHHVDLYRIDEKKDIEGLGLFEIMNEKNNIVVIEWAEKIKNILPKKRVDIYFENKSENERQMTIKNIE
ncbi:MAG: tRNA (adenosine(37)-N6)-threonylcarbamoyltransferase complex ATPase subunit type 1 TsaE [Patescibacteria group bacterium]|nr:tRNA (adenosine(37)-N6)-threonylcarbamoyltransferase complex ATPase subunit type 1 TsaE [Patescibacteria group bacterium]